MVINVEGAVNKVHFEGISEGEFFAPFSNSVYLKVQRDVLVDGHLINAIDMEGGHLAYFEDTQEVYPLDSEVNISYRHYGYTIENH